MEQGLENLFSLESLTIKQEILNYDEQEIKKIEQSINYKKDKYYVDIPCNREMLPNVPHNFGLAKVLARKVSSKNAEADDDYWQVFQQQKDLGIIEEIVLLRGVSKHIWILHRAVIRNDPMVKNTKIRPVFNCSLKSGQSVSLNEAVYPGGGVFA